MDAESYIYKTQQTESLYIVLYCIKNNIPRHLVIFICIKKEKEKGVIKKGFAAAAAPVYI
jgi:hypothetical protein